jgi:hypothetical protein
MNYCTQENGMNQPLSIQPNQVSSTKTPTPSHDINPTTSNPGLTFYSPNPVINITLDQPTTLTLIYVPTDRPNLPSNVDQFIVVFVFPNGTVSDQFTSEIPSTSGTSTTPSTGGVPSGTTVSPSGVVPPSSVSPQVDLPSNFEVPSGTVVMIVITSTADFNYPRDVSLNSR